MGAPQRRVSVALFALTVALAVATEVTAQSTTYHLHKEASSTSGLFQLKTAGPDAGAFAIQSVNLKNLGPGEYIVKAFDTQSGVPSFSGVIPSNSTLTFTLWMKKTASSGAMYPRARARLNTSTGALLCEATGGTALTQTLSSPYVISCTTGSAITVSASDRFYVWVGVNVTASPTTNNRAELDVEGTLDGNYDSRVAIPDPLPPAPSISALKPSSGPLGQAVTVSGSNFGSSPGTVTFNGSPASVTNWSATSIDTTVPAGATSGPVVVTVGGQASNGVQFTVTSGSGVAAVTYAYDELGRLIGVIDAAGQSAVYVYDAVGNLLAITRSAAGTVSIVGFSPDSGPTGTSVTITGTGFSATPSQNTVTFNGVAASVVSSTDYQIVAAVPASATTGAIGVTTPSGSASSATPFTVGAPGAPTISGFSPGVGAAGTPVTISGANFDVSASNNRVKFSTTLATVASSSASSIATSVPGLAASGRLSVATPTGVAVGSDFFVPPPPYVASDVGFTGRAIPGQEITVSLTANTIGLVVFDGAAGQKISLRGTNGTIQGFVLGCDAPVTILKPDTIALTSICMEGDGFLDSLRPAPTRC